MDKQYIIPVVVQIYHNRGGGEYRCTGNRLYMSDEQQHRALSLGDHVAYMERVEDGWSLAAHGVIQYGDGSIEWNCSTGEHFPY